jgi:hypothetical protein
MRHILAVICIPLLFASLSVRPVAAAITTLYPSVSQFSSPSTSVGVRRFLAVGNFFDTTNSAYYQSSIAEVEFELPQTNLLLESALVKLFKYANGGNSTVKIRASANGQELDSYDLGVDNLDYQQLQINLPLNVIINGKVKINLEAIAPEYRAGVALCSGNSEDSICPRRYFPQLELQYRDNVKGKLIETSTEAATTLNSNSQSKFSNCAPNAGCQLRFVVHYQDPDSNTNLELLVSSTTARRFKIPLNSRAEFDLHLLDGSYKLQLEIKDGTAIERVMLTDLKVVTKLPPIPELLLAPAVVGKLGAELQFTTPPQKSYAAALCADQHCQKILVSMTTNTAGINLRSPTALTSGRNYYYRFIQTDNYGNTSLPKLIAIRQENQLVDLFAKLTLGKISPKNADKRFDSSAVTFATNNEIAWSELEVFNSAGKLLGKLNKNDLRFAGMLQNKLLADGNYILRLQGADTLGYPIVAKQFSVVVDNTAPKIY